jgi:rhamnosyltransferase
MNATLTTATPPRFALGFVTYNAGPSLVRRLELASAAGYAVYLFDNSPERDLLRDTCRRLTGARYFTCGMNAGLGVGIASICANAYYDGSVALIFFDQDTVFDLTTLDFVGGFLAVHPRAGITHSSIVFNAKRSGAAIIDDPFGFHDVLLSISSGSLFYLENLRRIGWHNPTYFVDYVDYEFCLNSNNHGLLVGECQTTPGFDHEMEQADHTASLLGHRRRLRRYPWSRIRDSLIASTRLIVSSILTRNGRFTYAITRSLVGYIWWQFLVRLIRSPAPAR